jgi:hypothetical protein
MDEALATARDAWEDGMSLIATALNAEVLGKHKLHIQTAPPPNGTTLNRCVADQKGIDICPLSVAY